MVFDQWTVGKPVVVVHKKYSWLALGTTCGRATLSRKADVATANELQAWEFVSGQFNELLPLVQWWFWIGGDIFYGLGVIQPKCLGHLEVPPICS